MGSIPADWARWPCYCLEPRRGRGGLTLGRGGQGGTGGHLGGHLVTWASTCHSHAASLGHSGGQGQVHCVERGLGITTARGITRFARLCTAEWLVLEAGPDTAGLAPECQNVTRPRRWHYFCICCAAVAGWLLGGSRWTRTPELD